MKYKAIKEVLPRKQDKNLNKILNQFARLIEDAINFGTHIVKWDADKKRAGDENLPQLLFFRNILEIGDAISILVKKSSIETCNPLLRSLLENSFSLEYLLEQDTEQRALSFLVWQTHGKLKFNEKMDSSSQTGKQFARELKKDKLIGKTTASFFDKPVLAIANQVSIDLLKRLEYIPIEKEYQRTSVKRKNPNWYSLYDGPRNIEQLAKHLERHALYEILYRSFSSYVHATNIINKKLVPNQDGTTGIVQIRYPEQAQSITINTLNILLETFNFFIEKRLPRKRPDYKQWRLEFRKGHNELLIKKSINII